jgi:hypothetical protein
MQDVYASLVLAECPLVLGKRMLPFSLWHSTVLEAFDSPLLSAGELSPDDVVMAAWVCSRDFESCATYLRTRRQDITADAQAWGASCTAEDLAGAVDALRRYVRSHSYVPHRHGGSAEPSAAQWQLVYVLALTGGSTDPDAIAKAWNTPLNVAVALTATRAIMAGDKTYVTEEAEAGLQAARAAMRGDNGNG